MYRCHCCGVKTSTIGLWGNNRHRDTLAAYDATVCVYDRHGTISAAKATLAMLTQVAGAKIGMPCRLVAAHSDCVTAVCEADVQEIATQVHHNHHVACIRSLKGKGVT